MKARFLMQLLLLTYTSAAQAGFIRLIAFKLNPACTSADFLVINQDMNQFSNEHGVSAEVMLPIPRMCIYGNFVTKMLQSGVAVTMHSGLVSTPKILFKPRWLPGYWSVPK
jgi:hypothetical protein